MDIHSGSFAWNAHREIENLKKHGVGFEEAAKAFSDPAIKIFIDAKHNGHEDRFFCVGKVGHKVLTVRFTYRDGKIRIFGAGYWRKGRVQYEKESA